MAPEILLGKEYNSKCDLWSCGVILYLIVAGYPPFYASSREEIIARITAAKVDFIGSL